ncbi:MAG: hypothetical protein M3O94_03330, partial [Actinomycetota bacterium]|nr:hypothetical protein [Actinomycetota bacterium]
MAMAAVLAVTAAGPAAASVTATLHFSEFDRQFTYVDNDPPGPSIGDEFTGNGVLTQHVTVIGHVGFNCVAVNNKTTWWQCTG